MNERKLSNLIVCTLVNDEADELVRTYNSILSQNCKVTWVLVTPKNCRAISVLIAKWKKAKIVDLVLEDQGDGIYSAMNFALNSLPAESWIWFLNAGDEFSTCNSYDIVCKQISSNPNPWYFGGFLLADTNQNIVRRVNPPESFKIGNQLFARKFINHQSFICKNDLMRRIGGFNEDFKVASDWDLICRVSRLATGVRISEYLVIFHLGGISTRFRNVANKELKIIRKLHLSNIYIPASNLWYLYRFFRNYLVQFLEGYFPNFTHNYRKSLYKLHEKINN